MLMAIRSQYVARAAFLDRGRFLFFEHQVKHG
jgi:hypothetical protein